MQATSVWQLWQCEVEKFKVLWTVGQLLHQWRTGWSQMVILWPVIVQLSFTFSQMVIAWPVIVQLSFTFSQMVIAWSVRQQLWGITVEDCISSFYRAPS